MRNLVEPIRFPSRGWRRKEPNLGTVPLRELMNAPENHRFTAAAFEHLMRDFPPYTDVLVVRF